MNPRSVPSQNAPEQKDEVWNVHELIRFLGMSVATFRRIKKTGCAPPTIRFPGGVKEFYLASSAVNWLRELEQEKGRVNTGSKRGPGRPRKVLGVNINDS
jgi:hypothetical protein